MPHDNRHTTSMAGVPYTKEESFIGFFVYNLITGTRHLSVILRKSDLCACGCRGWCTLYTVFQFLAWSFISLAAGKFPTTRHDDGEWLESDGYRQKLAGKPMKMKAILLQIKADWSEFTTTFGFPNWQSTQDPCMFCKCDSGNMLTGLSKCVLAKSQWEEKTFADYDEACRRCEFQIVITTQGQLERIRANLHYDKRVSAKGLHHITNHFCYVLLCFC